MSAFDADKAAEDVVSAAFDFTWRGKLYAVPPTSALPTGLMRRVVAQVKAKTFNGDAVFKLLENVWPKSAYAALMEMPLPVVNRVTSAWLHGSDDEDQADGDEAGKEPSQS